MTSALVAMGIKTTYEEVMGVSGACYRLAFSSPRWDYSSVDGLVAYDYATPAYRAFGFSPIFSGRIEKEKRAEERRKIVDEIRNDMPVLGINLRCAAEWGVICGYRDEGTTLFCRTKYDERTISSPDFIREDLNKYNYLPVEHWPFIITYFGDKTPAPSTRDNLISSLKIFTDCARKEKNRGYAIGLCAYRVWRDDLLSEEWYETADDEQLTRRLSVNQFCSLALLDARRAAHVYLSQNKATLAGQAEKMNQLALLFGKLEDATGRIHALLDSGEYIEGERARLFFSRERRIMQAELLSQMLEDEREALDTADEILLNL